MMFKIMMPIIALMTLAANAQWTNPPVSPSPAGSWTNTPSDGGFIPGPNAEPDTIKPGPAAESWRRHVSQTTDAHGGLVAAPTNAAQTGWALFYSATGRPYYGPISLNDLSFNAYVPTNSPTYTSTVAKAASALQPGTMLFVTNSMTQTTNTAFIEGYFVEGSGFHQLQTGTNEYGKVYGDFAIQEDQWLGPGHIGWVYNNNGGDSYPCNWIEYMGDNPSATGGQYYDWRIQPDMPVKVVVTNWVDTAIITTYDITTNTVQDLIVKAGASASESGLTNHVAETTTAHGGIMRGASNPGANGQVLLLNSDTGRPYWGDPTIEGGINYLITSGVARVNGRTITTNYTVTVSNGTWDGTTATLTPTGMLTVVSSVPVARWEYVKGSSASLVVADEINTGSWESQEHGLLSAGDIYSVRSVASLADIPSIITDTNGSISISNLVVWTWGAPGLCGSSNDFQGTVVQVDDPDGALEAVNLRTLQGAVSGIDKAPRDWASYDAAGAPNKIDGVNMGGRRVYLDNQWSLLGSGRYCALSYCGRDIMYVSMSNKLLAVSGLVAGPVITVAVSTNGVTSRPWIEYTTDLSAGNWFEITNATSTYPTKTNGTYVMTFSNIWTTAFFRAVQASTNVNGLVVTVPLTVPAITLGGVTKTAWPVGATGPAGAPGTNITVFVGSAVGPEGQAGRDGRDGRDGLPGQDGIIGRDGLPGQTPTISVTNTLTGDAACTNVGTATNVILQFTLPPGPQGEAGPGMTNMPAVWDADTINTNRLFIKIGNEVTVRFDTNGLTMLKGSVQLFEEDLDCNVRLYDGTRLAPSLSFMGHANEFGMYSRGWNGAYGAGWSMGGVEIGVLHNGGITLMSTNSVFNGRHLGDISGATGYPEPIFTSWQTNMNFTTLTLSNLTVTPGGVDVRDTLNTVRTRVDTTGITYKNAGGITRSTVGDVVYIKDELGRNRTMLDMNGVTTYDAPSQMPILGFGTLSLDTISCKFTGGNLVYSLNANYGLRLYDPYQTTLRYAANYQGTQIYNASSQAVFSVDSGAAALTTMMNVAVTNSGVMNFYGSAGTNLVSINGGTGAIKVRGVDSDTRYPVAPTGMTAFIATNIVGTVTQRIWYTAQGIVTNHVP